jgi:hypothetical protein
MSKQIITKGLTSYGLHTPWGKLTDSGKNQDTVAL